MTKQTCYIFFYDGYVGIAPTILSLSKTLDKENFLITIFATQNDTPQPEKLGKKVEIIYFKKKFDILEFLNRFSGLTSLIKFLEAIIFSIQCLTKIFQDNYLTETSKNHINIGIDFHGALTALACKFLLKQKYLFLSLELAEPRKQSFTKLLVKITNLVYKKAECVVIQDRDRFDTLGEYYQYKHPKVFYLPNSPLNNSSLEERSRNFFRDKFNLSKEEFPYLILQAGMIKEYTCAKALAQSFVSIDNGSALIFHAAVAGMTEETSYIKSLRQMNVKNLFLSLNPVSYEEVDSIYASSTIGLAFYNYQVDNFTKIAMASGKLAFYLKHGKPVLVSNLESLSQLIDKYQCGLVINNPSDSEEIKLALAQIIEAYDKYSKNARTCFEAEFSFEKNMEPILSFVESLQALPQL